MGLCKCPKRSVTNLFCFEHRVNVCEHCLVSNHSRCVVQSYLNWLQDSDYDPTCGLCSQPLADDATVRLVCYHVFHTKCVNKHFASLPGTTAPAGYACTACNSALFPPENQAGPVADCLRASLAQEKWARPGLGLPLIQLEIENNATNGTVLQETAITSNGALQFHDSNSGSTRRINEVMSTDEDLDTTALVDIVATHPAFMPTNASNESSTGLREKRSGNATNDVNEKSAKKLPDNDDNKYQRRSPLIWIVNYLKSRGVIGMNSSSATVMTPTRKLARWATRVLLFVLFLITLIAIMQILAARQNSNDPMLDPKLNPNIHVKDV